jgi:hypothetical protein
MVSEQRNKRRNPETQACTLKAHTKKPDEVLLYGKANAQVPETSSMHTSACSLGSPWKARCYKLHPLLRSCFATSGVVFLNGNKTTAFEGEVHFYKWPEVMQHFL